MKKTINGLVTGCMMLIVFSGSLQAKSLDKGITGAILTSNHPFDWMKSTTGTWPGMKDGKTYWYKLDKKAGLWWSTDGASWDAVKDGTWMDSDGKWLKIHHKKLVWSTDGKTWSEVPEWKWKGSDGKWYKFDASWTLWVNG